LTLPPVGAIVWPWQAQNLYGFHHRGVSVVLKRTLAFLLAILIIALGIGLLTILFNTPNGRQRRAMEKMRRDESRLAGGFDVLVIQSGYRVRKTEGHDIYIPALLVRATNISSETSKAAGIRAEFLRKGEIFCAADSRIPELNSGESSEIWLKCIDLVGFGSIARGLSLAETTEATEYRISLEARNVTVTVLEGTLRTEFF